MDHYEELGIDRTATEEEIRRAHRRLTKLLHPDQQTDEGLKQLAGTQMRRLNSIVETLVDPQRRQQYDEELRRGVTGFPGGKIRHRAFHSWPWWVASTVGAIVLTVGAVWFSADRWGSSFGDHTPTYIPSGAEANSEPNRTSSLTEAPPSPAPAPAPTNTEAGKASRPAASEPAADAKPTSSRTIANVPAAPPANLSSQTAPNRVPLERPNQTVVVAEAPRHKTLNLPLTVISAQPHAPKVSLPAAPALPAAGGPEKVEIAALPSGSLPAPPKLPDAPAPTKVSYTASAPKVSPASKPQDALEGEWVYAPTEPEKRKAGFYPPEYIDLRIWSEGGLRGEYRARYHVTDKPISPDVSFALEPDGNPRHFTWASSNGSKGTLKVDAMDAGSIKIEWKTTVFSPAPALTAGTATLVRRNP